MTAFFTSDEHYGHRNIIKYCNRPFANVDEMRETLIANHSAKVGTGDITYHLGDIFWRTLKVTEALDILKRLNGQHAFIWGNHDELIEKMMKVEWLQLVEPQPFIWIKDTALVKPNAQYPAVWLSHYAHRVWPKSHKGSYHVFGHTHAVLPDYRRSHDVGVDANGYAPVSMDELHTLMSNKVVKADEVELDMEKKRWEKEPGDEQAGRDE